MHPSLSYLLDEHVRQPVDEVVALAGRQQAVPPAPLQAGQEVRVQLQQALQPGEQLAAVHLQVLPELVHVHSQHDLQRAHVVHLRLHQLCGGENSTLRFSGSFLRRSRPGPQR